MAEQTFRSPGFFEKEIDLSSRKVGPVGTPAGIIGTAEKGPAFVPVTVGSFADFQTRFGGLSPDRFGPYAVREFLKNRTAVTYMRVLGAGANDTLVDIDNTKRLGTVKNAGFVLGGTGAINWDPSETQGRHSGVTQFLVARHQVSSSCGEMEGYPAFSDNDSFAGLAGAGDEVNLVRAVIMTPSGSRVMIANGDEDLAGSNLSSMDDCAGLNPGDHKTFKLIISSSTGKTFAEDDGLAGIKIMTASLDPSASTYVGKILNRDPNKFQTLEHYLYADFAVEDELARVVTEATKAVAILSGSGATSADCPLTADETFRQLYGRYDTRYTTPTTPWIVSQPYGGTEYPLFRFETLTDGAYANDKIKISIANLRASTDPNNKTCSFEVQVRRFGDTDMTREIIEAYPDCNLDPQSDRYIGRLIGDYKVLYDFDADQIDERRLVVSGKYPNRSHHIRVIVHESVDTGDACLPEDIMPFGFLGIPTIKTADSLTHENALALTLGPDTLGPAGQDTRLAGVGATGDLQNAIVPPLPLRFKCTRGHVMSSCEGGTVTHIGQSGNDERADSRLYWGVKFERLPTTGSMDRAILNANLSSTPNPLVSAYTKFMGIAKLDTLVTGSGADTFNNNKFTLARVALNETAIADVDGTAKTHMLETAYIRNGVPDAATYTVNDPGAGDRVTLASLVHNDAIKFNRFTPYAKFTLPFYGGFDGLNILDKDNALMTDRASSSDLDGLAAEGFEDDGLGGTLITGEGRDNNIVNSYNVAVRQMTDPLTVNTNLLAIPGIRDSFVTDFAADRTKEYSKAMYVMDIPNVAEDGTRMFVGSLVHDELKPDVRNTSEEFESRAVDNNYSATYFPDVYIDDPMNNLKVRVPASVAALAALGYNDKVSYPWFAPAGFNRGALSFVSNVTTRLSAGDRDTLYDARINPIAVFPSGGFVIFGQKTLQMNKSALDRVNVRRMLLEVKRQIVGVANRILFEPNTPQTRARFIGSVTPLLALVQAQAGIEKFQVIMDDTNNSQEDYENNRLNGRIVVVPTRAIEFIAIDFIITNSGVIFA
ncbi:MAG: hypothetical protein CME70_06160 [Halobacteriovorax sp.]|nr:hypothetical protein [Halobacteriovorax sp.]|tara:strand:- start:10045 stop:13197 length:3153 start_codon:yes stop_codon:yes gene_type:complete